MRIGEKFLDTSISALEFLHDGVYFHTVARRQQHSFFDSGISAEPRERLPKSAFWNSQLFPDLHRGSFMAESDDDNMHIKTPTRSS